MDVSCARGREGSRAHRFPERQRINGQRIPRRYGLNVRIEKAQLKGKLGGRDRGRNSVLSHVGSLPLKLRLVYDDGRNPCNRRQRVIVANSSRKSNLNCLDSGIGFRRCEDALPAALAEFGEVIENRPRQSRYRATKRHQKAPTDPISGLIGFIPVNLPHFGFSSSPC